MTTPQQKAEADLITRMGDLIVHHMLTKGGCTERDLRDAAFDRDAIAAYGSRAEAYAENEYARRMAERAQQSQPTQEATHAAP